MKASPHQNAKLKSLNTSGTPKNDDKILSRNSHSKEKDKTISIDLPRTTKATQNAHSGKGNNSSTHNFSETTLSSQLFRDSISKEYETKLQKMSPSRKTSKVEEHFSSSPKKVQKKNKQSKQNRLDWKKILRSKENKVKDLENVIASMHQDIDNAVNFLEKNEDLPKALKKKEQEKEALYSQLTQILQEIEHIKSEKKTRPTHNVNESSRNYADTERQENPSNRNLSKDSIEARKREENLNKTNNCFTASNENSETHNPQSLLIKNSKMVAQNKGIKVDGRTKIKNPVQQSEEPALSHVEGMEQLTRFLQANNNNTNSTRPAPEEKNKVPQQQDDRTCKSYRAQPNFNLNQDSLMKLLRKLKRSMSPRGDDKLQNDKRFEMYNTDLVKKPNAQNVKPRQTVNVKKESQEAYSQYQPVKKYSQPVLLTEHITADKTKSGGDNNKVSTKKFGAKHRGASSLSPRRELLLTQKMKMPKRGKDVEKRKESMKTQSSRLIMNNNNSNNIKKKEGAKTVIDPVTGVALLLEEYHSVAEKYKRTVEVLKKKNKNLEGQIKDLNQSKANPEQLE